MVTVSISTQKKSTLNLDFPSKSLDTVTIADVKSAVHARIPKLVANRQRITLPVAGEKKPLPLTDEAKTLSSYGVKEGNTLRLKDLGKQVDYRVLYLWEYVGPIFLNPLFLQFSKLLWGQYETSALQLTVRNILVLHFIKRFLESAFVHRFSRATVPLSFVYRNCIYYWGTCGLLIGLTLYRPAYSAKALSNSILNSSSWLTFWSIFILIAELLNLNAHWHQRSLRTAPGQPRKYPTGLGFGTVVCANYWFEILGVVGLVAITGCDVGTVFYLAVGARFMAIWAGQKYARYQKEFDPKVFPGKRWKMFPPFY